jgi:hypothetical protein
METIGLKRCPKQHILGQMRMNGDHVEVFELFRQAIDYGEDMPEPVDVIAVISGRVTEIRCSICGGLINWNEARPRKSPRVAFE